MNSRIWLLGLLFSGSGLEAAQDQAASLKNIVIEGESRIRMRGDKPVDIPNPSPREAIEKDLAQRMTLISPGEKLLANVPVLLPARLASDVVLSPWHQKLWTPPVLSLEVRNAALVPIKRWSLVITDDHGQVFRRIQEKGSLPPRIEWDGLGDSGEPMRVGHSYACTLSVLDKSDVPTHLANREVRVASYVHAQDNRVSVLLETRQIFVPGPALSAEGQQRLRETRDWLRPHHHRTIRVEVYGHDMDLAQRQAEQVRKYLANGLHLRENDIKARGHAAKDSYHRTEISAR